MRVKQKEANLKKIGSKRATSAPYLADPTQEEANLKKIRRKRATVAPYLLCAPLGSLPRPGSSEGKIKKIGSKRATVAPYSMLYRVLCNALQRASQKAKKIGSKCATVAPYLAEHTRECQPRHPQVMRAGQPLIK